MRKKKKIARLVIDFPSEDSLGEFIEGMRCHEVLPRDAAVYCMDGLDELTPHKMYILKREGSRPEEMRLVVAKTETESRGV